MNRYEQSAYIVVHAETEDEADTKIVRFVEAINDHPESIATGWVSLEEGVAELVEEDVEL